MFTNLYQHTIIRDQKETSYAANMFFIKL